MNIMFKTHSFILVLFLSMSILVSSCGSGTVQEPQAQPIPVKVNIAEYNPQAISHILPAVVSSEREANLSTIVMGTLSQVNVEVGDEVRRGTLLATIRDEQIRAQKMQLEANLVQANAQLANANRNFERITNLFNDDSATQKELDDITTMVESAKASVAALEAGLKEVNEMLEYTRITAPFDGVVTQRYLRAGDMAAPGHPILVLADPSTLKLSFSIPETLIRFMNVGKEVLVSIPSAGITPFESVITRVSASANPMNRQFSAEIVLKDALDSIKPGMHADIKIATEGSSSIMVPQEALVYRGQLTGMYTISNDNTAVLRWIRTGSVMGEFVEVVSGLSAGEQYVAVVSNDLAHGSKVSKN